MTCISPGGRCWLLSASDRGCPWFTAGSGTQRAQPSDALRACPHRAGAGPRPVRAGSWLALDY